MSFLPLLEDQNPWWRDPHARLARPYRRTRAVFGTLLAALTGDDRRAALVRGQRQVGKTTLLWQCADRLLDERWPARNVTYCDLSDERVHDPNELLRALDQ